MPTLAETRKKFPQYDDMSDADFAEGMRKKYYADMPKEEFNAKVGYKPEPTYNPADNAGVIAPTLHDATTGVGDAMTLGFKDELLAGMAAPFRAGYNALTGGEFDLGAAYDKELEGQRKIQQTAEERSPIATMVGQIAGGIAAPTMAAKAVPATVTGMAARTAGQGALTGGAYGFGSGEGSQERIEQGGEGAAIGGAVGGVLGAATGGVNKVLARRAATKAEDIEKLGDAAYDAMDGLPAYDPAEATDLVKSLRAKAKAKGVSKASFPRVHSIIRDIEKHIDETGSIDPNMLDTYRQRLNSVRKDPSYSTEVGHVVDELDDIAQNKIGGEHGVEARARWRQKIQLSKVENAVEDAYEAAKRGSGNVSQHLKVHVGKLLRADRNAMTRGRPAQFDKEMRDQMQQVVDNGTIEGLLNWLGKASPDSGLGMLGHTLTALSGGSSALVQVPVAVGAYAAKKAGAGYTLNNVDALKRTISHDPSPQVRAAARDLLKRITKGTSIGAQ